jgi:2-keto-4-pentenoate hydratase/2-oxohepta-3-ene-1,7-dioic acid hydratase in catechol pathway
MKSALRLVSFQSTRRSLKRIGLLINQQAQIIDLSHASIKKALPDLPALESRYSNRYKNGMSTLIEYFHNNTGAKLLKDLQGIVNTAPKESLLDASKCVIHPPIIPNRNVFCVGKNYQDHIAEVNNKNKEKDGKAFEASKYCVFFTKAPQSIVGHLSKVESHSKLTKWLDYEAELAVIIGKKGRDISLADANQYIFGYTIANDITARDLQKSHHQFFKGKTLDTTCPLGPSVVLHSPKLDPGNLNIQLYLNNNIMQDSNTKNMIFSIPQIIHQLSQGFTLYPGDVILTGTPSGVGFARNPPITLKQGDHMRVVIENIGSLENTISE